MNSKQLLEWDSNQYKSALEAKRGHNYQYWNDDLQKKIDSGEWILYNEFEKKYGDESYATSSECLAKGISLSLKGEGYYARVICGYSKNIQKIKMFSVIYKRKK